MYIGGQRQRALALCLCFSGGRVRRLKPAGCVHDGTELQQIAAEWHQWNTTRSTQQWSVSVQRAVGVGERVRFRRPVCLLYQPLALLLFQNKSVINNRSISITFLLEQISHQQPASSTFLSEQTSTSHQPLAKRTGCWLLSCAPKIPGAGPSPGIGGP
jgi:hypothetical protein